MNLPQKTILLLDKLYNLKGSDNIILQEIISKIEGTKNSIAEAEQKQKDLEQQKGREETDLLVFTNQQETFLSAFSEIDDNTFAELRKIGVDVNIGSMVSAVREKAPNFMEDLQQKIYGIQREISEAEATKAKLEGELHDLSMAKEKAEADRSTLEGLMEQVLSSDPNERGTLPPNRFRDVLNRFGVFDASEISTLTKLLLFPEDGLEEYDRGYADRLANGLVGEAEVIEADHEEPVQEVKEEPVDKKVVRGSEIRDVDTEDKTADVITPVIVKDDAPVVRGIEEVIEPVDEKTSIMDLGALNGDHQEPIEKKETAQEFLESLGLDINKFHEENENDVNIEQLMSELASTDKELIKENFELLKSLNAEEVAYRYANNHSYLMDKDLARKITLLRATGISENNIRILLGRPNSGLKESYDVILNRINAAEEMGKPIDDEHTDLLATDLVKLAENIRVLNEYEIAIDDKEFKNNEYTLTVSDFIKPNLEILKNYLINITRSNDKYALNVFLKSPYSLLTDIDTIIEYNLEDVLSTNPEVLTGEKGSFVERVKYFEGLGKPITDPSGKNAFAPYVINLAAAFKENGESADFGSIPTEEEVNKKLPEIIGNENISSSLVKALNDYYLAREEFKEIELAPEAQESYNRLMQRFVELYQAENIGQYTWRVANGFISKNKLERHLKILLNAIIPAGETIDGIENELLLTSMLYNHCYDEETLRKMVETCLGFKEENTLGGMTL